MYPNSDIQLVIYNATIFAVNTGYEHANRFVGSPRLFTEGKCPKTFTLRALVNTF